MGPCNGVHHLAIATADIKAQIAFFSDVLGMELVALYWMHGVEGAWHGFLKLNDHSSIAFVQTPDIGKIERTLGVTHAGSAAKTCAGGAMQHVSFNVDTEEEPEADRCRGVPGAAFVVDEIRVEDRRGRERRRRDGRWRTCRSAAPQLQRRRSSRVSMSCGLPSTGTGRTRSGRARISARAPSSPLTGRLAHIAADSLTGGRRSPS